MAKQFEKLDCSRGAPMGRLEYSEPPTVAKSVRVFKVKLDSGGYDDGGAYWGLNSRGKCLYCATDGADYRQFCRAESRLAAIIEFRLARFLLRTIGADFAKLKNLEKRGTISAGGIARLQALENLGF